MARELYWQGWRISEIARHLGLKAPAVYSWKSRDNWDGGSPAVRVAASAEMRLHVLIAQPKKSDADYKEMRQLFALVSGGKKADARQPDLNEVEQAAAPVVSDGLPWDVPTIDKPPRERRERENVRAATKPAPNSFTAEQVLRLQEILREQMFEYQRIWYDQKVRFRNLLKSRQIGATFFFAREALVDALTTGKIRCFCLRLRRRRFSLSSIRLIWRRWSASS